MSDMQMPPQGPAPQGQAPQGGPEAVKQRLQGNMSMFNPTDAAMMKQQIDPNMTLRQFFETQGYDVDRTTLIQFAQDQMKKAQPINKAQAIAGKPIQPRPQAPVPGGPTPGPAPSGSPNFGSMISGMRGR